MRLAPALAALFVLTLTLPARADWSLLANNTDLMLEDDDDGLFFLEFDCSKAGRLTVDYSSDEDDTREPFPLDASVRLEIWVKGRKSVSFPVVLDDEDGSLYRVGDRDARRVLALVGGGAPFSARLRLGEQAQWGAYFGTDGYADVKDQVSTFCPKLAGKK
jgi:hypothetical protein